MTYLFDMPANSRKSLNNFDRWSGYAIIVVLLLILALLTWLGTHLNNNPQDTRIIAFQEIGNLKTDDPVKFRGIDIGTIKKIELRGEKVLISIKTKKPLSLHQGYRIDDRDIGLMGDRILMIYDGDSSAQLVPKTDTLAGMFYNGISESVGLAWKLRDIVDSFTVISSQFLHGAAKRKSLVKQINTMINITDSASSSIMIAASRVHKNFNAQVDSIEKFTASIKEFSKSAAASAPGYISSIQARSKDLAIVLDKLDALSDTLMNYTDLVEKAGITGKPRGADQIKGKINELHDAINHLKERLLKFQIYFK